MNAQHSIAASKLKRHKIAFTMTPNQIVLGKSKLDILTIVGLVIFPIVSFFVIVYFAWQASADAVLLKMEIVSALFFMLTSAFLTYQRLLAKKRSNGKVKVIRQHAIEIQTANRTQVYDRTNIAQILVEVNELDQFSYEGLLVLVDRNHQRHELLGFQDEQEKYVKDDIEFFAEFLESRLQLQK
ncbi:hypothetical protein SAMN05216480_106101 [Pustulibacterium marinum]|uniref:Uncharacterized protein n=1 Tax=Pustulibacterium marinum TaxID=1224947 RepID=A0A1I7GYN8_9FLAO|nr:hypothetical protein [Pustulibacterium marinum]SFU53515.1 hypothetical protein SAMN05216480_106101 [Pustulibacterium marinum]